MKKFKYRSFQDYEVDLKSKYWSKEDIIDRTGYIPLSIQFDRMMSSGINYTRVIDSQYNTDWKDIEQAYKNDSLDVSSRVPLKRFNDKTVLDDKLKLKLAKYKKAVADEAMLTDLHSKYLKGVENERLRQEIINEYVAQQKQSEKKE